MKEWNRPFTRIMGNTFLNHLELWEKVLESQRKHPRPFIKSVNEVTGPAGEANLQAWREARETDGYREGKFAQSLLSMRVGLNLRDRWEKTFFKVFLALSTIQLPPSEYQAGYQGEYPNIAVLRTGDNPEIEPGNTYRVQQNGGEWSLVSNREPRATLVRATQFYEGLDLEFVEKIDDMLIMKPQA